MKNIKIFQLILLITIALSVWNCDDPYDNYIDYAKFEADERALLERFYNNKNFMDSLFSLAVVIDSVQVEDSKIAIIDTVDHRETSGLLMIRTYKSPQTDSIKVGHYVGFRYTFWGIVENENGEPEVHKTPILSNVTWDDVTSFEIGNRTTSSYANSGIDEAVRYMFLGDKCTLILPSSIGAQILFSSEMNVALQYTTVIADIEVTYWTDR